MPKKGVTNGYGVHLVRPLVFFWFSNFGFWIFVALCVFVLLFLTARKHLTIALWAGAAPKHRLLICSCLILPKKSTNCDSIGLSYVGVAFSDLSKTLKHTKCLLVGGGCTYSVFLFQAYNSASGCMGCVWRFSARLGTLSGFQVKPQGLYTVVLDVTSPRMNK